MKLSSWSFAVSLAYAYASSIKTSHASDRQQVEYDYITNGDDWNVGECRGLSQSPVDLAVAVESPSVDLDHFYYRYLTVENPFKTRFDGKLLTADLSSIEAGNIALGSRYPHTLSVAYDLIGFAIHTPSEHTFGGVRVPLELQLFHTTRDTIRNSTTPVVVSAAVAVGYANAVDASPVLASILSGGLPTKRNEECLTNKAFPHQLDFGMLFRPLAADGSQAVFWQYDGSLTAPPCSTGVRWFVRDDPLPATRTQLETFQQLITRTSSIHQAIPSNYRMFQDVGGRTKIRRTAENAIHSPSTSSLRNPAFDNAVLDAQAQQAELARVMATSSAGGNGTAGPAASAATTVRGAGTLISHYDQETLENNPEAVLVDDAAYQQCLTELNTVTQRLSAATILQDTACTSANASAAEFENSGAGVSRMTAGAELNSNENSCREERTVVEQASTDVQTKTEQCDALKAQALAQIEAAAESGEAQGGAVEEGNNEDAAETNTATVDSESGDGEGAETTTAEPASAETAAETASAEAANEPPAAEEPTPEREATGSLAFGPSLVSTPAVVTKGGSLGEPAQRAQARLLIRRHRPM